MRRHVYLRMWVRLIRITRKTRAQTIFWVGKPKSSALYRQLHGLKLAIKDPKVFLFAIMTTSQLLGLSFVQYFPT